MCRSKPLPYPGWGLIHPGSIITVTGSRAGFCITSLAIKSAGPRITLMLPPILSDPNTGMRLAGITGIRRIPFTGTISSGGILIGMTTDPATTIIKPFITGTIMARAPAGTKAIIAAPINPARLRAATLTGRPRSAVTVRNQPRTPDISNPVRRHTGTRTVTNPISRRMGTVGITNPAGMGTIVRAITANDPHNRGKKEGQPDPGPALLFCLVLASAGDGGPRGHVFCNGSASAR